MKRTTAWAITIVMAFVISFTGVSASSEAEQNSYGGKPDVTIATAPFPGGMEQEENSNGQDSLSLEEYIAGGYEEVNTLSWINSLNLEQNGTVEYEIVYSDNEVTKYQISQENGSMRFLTGWVRDGDYWIYYDNYGNQVTGWYKIDELWYYFDRVYGRMLTGWQEIDYEWYYFNPNGSMKHGWLYTGDQTTFYYMGVPDDPDTGAMYTGGWLHDITGKWYYINDDGKMIMGWKTVSGKTYYFLDTGVVDTSGEMVTGTHTVDGVTYMFDSKGVRINSAPPSNISNRSLYVLFCNDLVDKDDNLNAVHNIQTSMKGMGYTDCTYLAMPYYPYKAYAQLPYSKVAVLHGHGEPGVSFYQDPSAQKKNDNHMFSSRTLSDGSTYSSYGYWAGLNVTVEKDDYFIEDYLPGQLSNLDFVCIISCYSARKQLLRDTTKYMNESMAGAIHNKGAKAVMGYYNRVAGGEFYADFLFNYLEQGQDIKTAIKSANEQYAHLYGVPDPNAKEPTSPHHPKNQRFVGNGSICLNKSFSNDSYSQIPDNWIYRTPVKVAPSFDYTGTEQFKISKLYHVVNNVDAVIKTDYFTKDGIEYGYDETGRLVSIDMNREYTEKSSNEVTEERMLQSLRTQLSGWIPDAEYYDVSLFMESIGGYQAMMENEMNDIIAAYFDEAGKLDRVIIDYKNTFVPTVEQQAHYEAELEKYLSEKAGTYSSYTIETEYRSVQDKNFAIYTIYFERDVATGNYSDTWPQTIAIG